MLARCTRANPALIAFDMSSTQSYLLLVSCTPAVNNFEIFGHKFASFKAKGIF